MSTAFLATSHFRDQDSLSARMVQARFSGMFRFSCMAFKEFMADPTTAAAGSAGPEGTFPTDDADYTATWDRNYLIMAAALYAESYWQETGVYTDANVHEFWHVNCVEPNLHRSAVPKSIWQQDRAVYGEKDALLHEVPLVEFGPLLAYGSLRMLRDTVNGGAGFAEDYASTMPGGSFAVDQAERRNWRSANALWRNRICSPVYKYTIEHAIGDPPEYTGDPITDASSRFKRAYDLEVPNEDLGNSATREVVYEGCGLGVQSNGCDPSTVPTYEQSSLYQFVYVTSSHDESVPPGWHRLLHVALFPERACEANPLQICSSAPNTYTDNEAYSTSTVDAAGFQATQAATANSLGFDLAALQNPADTDDPVGTAAARAAYETSFATYRRKLAVAERQYLPGNRSYVTYRPTHAVARHPHGRQMFVFTLAVLGVVAIAGAAGAFDETGKELDFDTTLAKQLNGNAAHVTYIEMQINQYPEWAIDAPTSFRNGRDALFATRCSDFLKNTDALRDDPLLRCCGDGCAPLRPPARSTSAA